MTEPVGVPGAETPTTLDPGRVRDDGDATVLDPGRRRPTTTSEGLPPHLAVRFKVVQRLSRTGAPADVYLVRDRVSAAEHVVKLYRDGAPDPQVRALLLQRRRTRHLVSVSETEPAGAEPYDIMEHLAGGTLVALRERNPQGLDRIALKNVIGQVAFGLRAMHDRGLVHRDVKPANILLRTFEPFDLALVDFGLSQFAPEPRTVADVSGTVRYMPPEFAGRLLSPAYDWWSLGITVLELATGHPFLEGVESDEAIRVHVTGGPVNVTSIADPRVRMLCQGLLSQSRAARWGADQVEEWLNGGSPPLPAASPVAAWSPVTDEAEVDEPFVYLDTEYRHRRPLALHMMMTWQTAVGDLDRLEEWLRRLPGPPCPRLAPAEPADVRLLRLLRWMGPELPPIYRGEPVAWRALPTLAMHAAAGEGMYPELVRELWRYDLLPLLRTAAAADGGSADGDRLDSGAGLVEVRARWERRQQAWVTLAATVRDDGARAVLHPPRRDRPTADDRRLALTLWAASAGDRERTTAARDLRAVERRVRLAWFSDLAERSDDTAAALAYRLQAYAETVAAERDEAARAEAAQLAFRRRNDTLLEWSRRQNRPLALSWAVAGVFMMAVLCTLLVAVSDIAGWASDAAILDAWVAVVLGAAAVLAFETLLAWEIGGRFHPQYSMLGAGMIVLGRAARSIAGRGIALVVLVALAAGAYLLTAAAPLATPLVAGGGSIVWAFWRYLQWRSDEVRIRERIRTAQRQAG